MVFLRERKSEQKLKSGVKAGMLIWKTAKTSKYFVFKKKKKKHYILYFFYMDKTYLTTSNGNQRNDKNNFYVPFGK